MISDLDGHEETISYPQTQDFFTILTPRYIGISQSVGDLTNGLTYYNLDLNDCVKFSTVSDNSATAHVFS